MGKSFFTVSFYGEKTQLLKGGCRIAPIRTKPSKKARQGHGYPSFPSRPCHTVLCSWVIASGRRKQIRLGKGESALRVEFKGKYVRRSSRDDCDSSYGLLVDRLFVFLFRFNKLGTGSNGMFYIIISLVFIGIQLSATLSLTTLHGRMKVYLQQ